MDTNDNEHQPILEGSLLPYIGKLMLNHYYIIGCTKTWK